MNRRNFIKQSAAAGTFLAVAGNGLASCSLQNVPKHITILHTNDTHSRIEPFPDTDPRNANRGGVARRATLIQQVRRENPHTLLLDAGDIFQGTPYFNFFGGELEFRTMSMLGYDAATIGNHDFDNGIDGLYTQLPHAEFDFVISNYDFSNTVMDGHTKPFRLFVKDGVRIGVFGLGIELHGLVTQTLYKETRYLDPVGIAQDMVKTLRNEAQCDLVICLSHLGYDYPHSKISDVKLARQTTGIDLIIGGHTHTFLPRPEVVKNKNDQDVLINQVGFGGINLGRIDFYFDQGSAPISRGVVIEV